MDGVVSRELCEGMVGLFVAYTIELIHVESEDVFLRLCIM